MGLWDKIKGRGSNDESTGSAPAPDINKPYATVTYRDENGGTVELQAFSAVQADEIKADHPDAKITPKR